MASNQELKDQIGQRAKLLRQPVTQGVIRTPFAQRLRPLPVTRAIYLLQQEVEGDRAPMESGEKCCTHDAVCTCPACLGVQCLERPKYFSGQVLNEADMNGEQAYWRAKNRLHNRYLHGWGVVCGLEVDCGECPGEVIIHPGYALDPCGEDVLVCQDITFNIVQAVIDYHKQKRQPCDPYQPPKKATCPDTLEHWSITLSYKETDARPMQTLRRSCAVTTTGGEAGQPGALCLPTRTTEGFTIDLVPAAEGCCGTEDGVCLTGQDDRNRGLMPLVFERWKAQAGNPAGLEQTFLYHAMLCISAINLRVSQQLEKRLVERLGKKGQVTGEEILETLLGLACEDTDRLIERQESQKELQERGVEGRLLVRSASTPRILCDLYTALEATVKDIYQSNPPGGRCLMPDDYPYDDDCSPCNHEGKDYRKALSDFQNGARYWIDLLVDYTLDCLRRSFNPPCPTNTTCETVVLACAEVRCSNGEYTLEQVSASCCRRYAGSFNSEYYWHSITPTACELGGVMAGGFEQFQYNRLFQAQDSRDARRVLSNLRSLGDGRIDALHTLRPTVTEQAAAQAEAPAAVPNAAPIAEMQTAITGYTKQIDNMQARMAAMETQLAAAQQSNDKLLKIITEMQAQIKPAPGKPKAGGKKDAPKDENPVG